MAVELDFGDDGLIPAITQDIETDDILMLAYVSPEVLTETQNTGLAHYYSRSCDELWQKGQFSGNVQRVDEIRWTATGIRFSIASNRTVAPVTPAIARVSTVR